MLERYNDFRQTSIKGLRLLDFHDVLTSFLIRSARIYIGMMASEPVLSLQKL